MARQEPLVRFISPFGSPACMPRDRAEELLAGHDERWLRWQEAEQQGAGQLIDEHMREIGPPRIEVLPR